MDIDRSAGPGGTGHLARRLAGAGLLTATGAIHLDLYLTGYRSIPTIGWLFLVQAVAAFVLAAAVTVTGNWLVAAAAAGFALATLLGYLLSVWVGLFGFTEVRTTAGIVAGVIEVAAFAVLAAVSGSAARAAAVLAGRPAFVRDRMATGVRGTAALGVTSAAALMLLGVAVVQAGGTRSVAGTGGVASLKTATVAGATVLTNAQGFTLYWFGPDTSTASNCNGSCTVYWPPVKGPATAGPGVTGKLGTITRDDGSVQATYNGHPLYTYVGDHAPRQARGNNLDLNGGVWHEARVPG